MAGTKEINTMSRDDSGRDEGQKIGRRIQYMHPEEAIAVDLEIQQHHPELLRILSKYPFQPLETKVAAIAAYCNLGVDGNFREKDLKALFIMLLEKLKKKSELAVSKH